MKFCVFFEVVFIYSLPTTAIYRGVRCWKQKKFKIMKEGAGKRY